jgi:predicted adenylyl cyclase CyaB
MARNIEIKARIDSVESILPKAAALADKGPIEIVQDDTFFSCKNGRLKLRAFSSAAGELIYYRRPDRAGPKESFYLISPTSAPDVLRESLSLAYGQVGRVRKHRTLFLVGRTRIHLDRVENLGHFLEVEVVLKDDEAVETGEAIAQDLMGKLGI